ncbi:MAG: hypothetical protein ACTTHG_06255 [Treponemataceae bacterium]
MNIFQVILVSISVLKQPMVILVAVIVILYLNFMIYVEKYRKRPPRPKRRRKVEVPQEAPKENVEQPEESLDSE